ncbi:MAG TPA: cation diffusion facilitator family transporter [Gemmatimonadales bacterium]|nr:cation diffusion facilitator family transporter [Gemmatimonadales bacterium]
MPPNHPAVDRDRQVRQVLGALLWANLLVVAIKVGVGVTTGSLAVFGDVLHSSVDVLNNIFGLAITHFASRGPDADHPYGHAKFETLGALSIVVFLSVTIFELLRGAVAHLMEGGRPIAFGPLEGGLLVVTLGVNIWVAWYERRAAVRLGSEILLADAAHTRSDVWITLAVIGGLLLARTGYTWADPLLAVVVAGLVAHVGYEIVRRSMPTLLDQAAFPEGDLRRAAEAVPGVARAYGIRSRTASDLRFAEVTIAVEGAASVDAGHRIADAVEAALGAEFSLQHVLVHVEPC